MAYDFNMLGQMLSARNKITKHIRANDPSRVKDYVVQFYDTWSPKQLKSHPLWEDLAAGIRVLNRSGWSVFTGVWKDDGVQVIVRDPKGNCYRSHFNHKQ